MHLWLLFLELKLTKAKKEPGLQVLLPHRLPTGGLQSSGGKENTAASTETHRAQEG